MFPCVPLECRLKVRHSLFPCVFMVNSVFMLACVPLEYVAQGGSWFVCSYFFSFKYNILSARCKVTLTMSVTFRHVEVTKS